ncbi:MAG TPA: aminopeptidase P family protein [Candidatus Eisenbacteria bacterium]|nr:aminopeptidase P family protein [Candidatus Eisenbacteria bacterium]
MSLSPDVRRVLQERRARIGAAMGDGVMLLGAGSERLRSGDVHYPFRQDSDFDYVTGLGEPDCVAVLAPGHAEPYALFVPPRDPERAIWVGPRAGVEGAVADYDAAVAFPEGDFEKEIPRWLAKSERVWLDLSRQDALAQRLLAAVRRAQADRPRSGTGPTALLDAHEILHEERLFKTPDELARLRDAIGIACEAHREAMRTARPGMLEYEIEALLDYTFRRRGATGWAYPSIVAGGANATVLHYTANNCPLGADDLLLIDAGAERAGYCADVTRTWPIGKRFTPAQRDCYQAVLAAQLAAIGAVKPGVTLEAIHTTALRVLCEALVTMGLLEGTVDEIVEKEAYKRFYMHRTSHWLGRDVHDVGRYKIGEAPRPLAPRMVFTVEPGLYIAADAENVPDEFRGIGIRIEDDVHVTESGGEVLSAAAPKQIEELEGLREHAY